MKKFLIVITVFVLSILSVACNNNKENYDKAVSLMNQRNYEEAIVAFKALGDYNDSKDKAIEAYNKMIDEYLSVESVDKAIATCEQLELFAGKEVSNPTRYLIAQTCVNTANYEKAVAQFELLDGYKDASDLLGATRVLYARQLCDNGQIDKALEICDAENLLTKDEKYLVDTFVVGFEPDRSISGVLKLSKNDYNTIFGDNREGFVLWGVFGKEGADNEECLIAVCRSIYFSDSINSNIRTRRTTYIGLKTATSKPEVKMFNDMGPDSSFNVELINAVLHKNYDKWQNKMTPEERTVVLKDLDNWLS